MALQANGSVLAWGANDVGQLGDGTVYTANLTPSLVLFDDTTLPTLLFGIPTPSVPNGANGCYVTTSRFRGLARTHTRRARCGEKPDEPSRPQRGGKCGERVRDAL